MKNFTLILLLLSIVATSAQEVTEEPEATATEAKVSRENPKERSWLTTVGIFAAPISFRKVNKEKDLNYGLEFAADKADQEIRFFYERNAFSSTDPVNFITVRSS